MIDKIRAAYARLSPWARDTVERAASTGVQTFVAALPVSGALAAAAERDYSALWAIALSAGTAALGAAGAVVKARFAKRVGYPDSASLDPSV